MDDDAIIDRFSATELIMLINLLTIAYRAGYFEALGRRPPPITSAKLRNLLRHVRAEHWRSIEVAQALAALEAGEPEAPGWLHKRTPPTDEETEH